jgi:hypothetical protein
MQSAGEACVIVRQTIPEHGHNPLFLLYQILSAIVKNAKGGPLRRLLDVLGLECSQGQTTRYLRKTLTAHLRSLKNAVASSSRPVRREHARIANRVALDRDAQNVIENWPQMVSSSVKTELVRCFRQQKSSSHLAKQTCTSCSEHCLKSDCSATQRVPTTIVEGLTPRFHHPGAYYICRQMSNLGYHVRAS